jgi:Xaa-Pro aminopeptidase
MVQGSRTLPSVLSWASGSRPSPLPLVAQGTLQRGNVLVSDLVATTDGYRARAAQAVAVEACDPVIADLHTLQAEYWQSAFGLLRSGAPLGRIAEEAIEQGRRLAPNEGHLRSVEFEFRLVGCGLGGDLPRHSSLVTESGVSPPLRPGCVFCFDPAVTLQIGRWRYTARWSDTVVITPQGPQRLGLRQVGLTLAAS